MNMEVLTVFFGWSFVISAGFLLITTGLILCLKAPIARLHAKLFDLEPSALNALYFSYLGNMKIASIVLFLIPYISLKIMQ